MERLIKRQQRTIGSIVKIPLENGFHTYARILKSRIAFYDLRTTETKNERNINAAIDLFGDIALGLFAYYYL